MVASARAVGLARAVAVAGVCEAPRALGGAVLPRPSVVAVAQLRRRCARTVLGHPMPGAAADRLILATLGLEAWSYTGDVIAASAAFRSAVDGLIAEAATAPR